MQRDNGLTYDPNTEITVGAGAKQVIFNAMMATLEPGDEVIVLAPYFMLLASQSLAKAILVLSQSMPWWR